MLGELHFDYGDEDGKFGEGDAGEILRVLFGGDEGLGATVVGCLLEFTGVALIVVMVVGKFAGLGDWDVPRFEVMEKGFGVADASECVERTGADFVCGEELNTRAEAAETE